MELRHYIRDVPDFPAPGVLFRDITPLLRDAAAFAHALDLMAGAVREAGAEAVAAIESRGFLFGAPIAQRLQLPFVPVRKPGKLPAARMSVEYALEYGQGQLDIHADAFPSGGRVVIVDDLLATGGTARAAAQLVERAGGTPVAAAFLVELAALGGRAELAPLPVTSFVVFS